MLNEKSQSITEQDLIYETKKFWQLNGIERTRVSQKDKTESRRRIILQLRSDITDEIDLNYCQSLECGL